MATLGSLISTLRVRFRDVPAKYLTDSVATEYVNEASRHWARRTLAVIKAKGMKIISNKQRYALPPGMIRALWVWWRQQTRVKIVNTTKFAAPYYQFWNLTRGDPLFGYTDEGDLHYVPTPNTKEVMTDGITSPPIGISATALTVPAVFITGFPQKGRILLVDASILPSTTDSEVASGNVTITQVGGAIYPTGALVGLVEEVWYNNLTISGATMTFERCIRGSGGTTPLLFAGPYRIVRLSSELHFNALPNTLSALTDTSDMNDTEVEGVIAYALYLAFHATKQPNDAELWLKAFEQMVAQRNKENLLKRGDMDQRLNFGEEYPHTIDMV